MMPVQVRGRYQVRNGQYFSGKSVWSRNHLCIDRFGMIDAFQHYCIEFGLQLSCLFHDTDIKEHILTKSQPLRNTS